MSKMDVRWRIPELREASAKLQQIGFKPMTSRPAYSSEANIQANIGETKPRTNFPACGRLKVTETSICETPIEVKANNESSLIY